MHFSIHTCTIVLQYPRTPPQISKSVDAQVPHMLVGLVASVISNSCDPIDCSPRGSSLHGILPARILDWVAIPFSRGSSRCRNWTWVSCIAGRFFTNWATRETSYIMLQNLHICKYTHSFPYNVRESLFSLRGKKKQNKLSFIQTLIDTQRDLAQD